MPDDGDLDFERADFATGDSPPGTPPSTDAPSDPARMGCAVCGQEIADAYYTRDDAFVCARCEGPTRAAGPPGSAITRLAGAAAAGAGAAIVASALWMLVTELTGYEIGLIAIAVGWIVGLAVAIGSRGVGGWPYQLIAVFLTYTAIVMTYVPMLVPEIERGWAEQEATLAQAEPVPADPLAALEAQRDEVDEQARTASIWVTAIVISYAVPFLGGFENVIGLLIIGFGLYQAWSMTARRVITWAGPFQIGGGGPS